MLAGTIFALTIALTAAVFVNVTLDETDEIARYEAIGR